MILLLPFIILAFLLTPHTVEARSAILGVPFTTQAPYSVWTQPWADACEETSIAMVNGYYEDRTAFTQTTAKQAILDVFKIKESHYGKSLDETAERMADIVNNFYPWELHVVTDPTLDDIKTEIDNGRPVIAPVSAPLLHNPYFSGSFPYHAVVISGYDTDTNEFVIEEPGTRHGQHYRYSFGTILEAAHDFYGDSTDKTPHVMLFSSKKITTSGESDGDHDGLSKSDELRYGTSLFLADSDGDGNNDGIEVRNDFSPTQNETKGLEGSLVKGTDSPDVYLVEHNKKRHVQSEQVFLAHRWSWRNVRTMSNGLMRYLALGAPIEK